MKKSPLLSHALASALLGLGLLTGSGAAAARCNQCGVVSDVHTETQKGKATALGTVGGAVVGGILGNQIGKGDGNTVATVAGAVGGAYAGREIEKSQRKHTIWITTVRMRDGSYRTFNSDTDPGLPQGQKVRITDQGALVAR